MSGPQVRNVGTTSSVGSNDAALVAHLMHGGLHRRHTLRTTPDRGMTMSIVLIILVPLAILFAWAVVHDLKRRQRHAASAVDVTSRVRAAKAAVQANPPTESGGGGGI